MRDGDVFKWRFKDHEGYLKRNPSTAYWCMDNQCVYREGKGLIDTYWTGLDGNSYPDYVKYVNEESAILEFVCNLNEVEFIWEGDKDEYDNVYNLSHHKGMRKVYAVDRGVGKSKNAILAKKEQELADVNAEIEYLQRKVLCITREVNELSK